MITWILASNRSILCSSIFSCYPQNASIGSIRNLSGSCQSSIDVNSLFFLFRSIKRTCSHQLPHITMPLVYKTLDIAYPLEAASFFLQRSLMMLAPGFSWTDICKWSCSRSHGPLITVFVFHKGIAFLSDASSKVDLITRKLALFDTHLLFKFSSLCLPLNLILLCVSWKIRNSMKVSYHQGKDRDRRSCSSVP